MSFKHVLVHWHETRWLKMNYQRCFSSFQNIDLSRCPILGNISWYLTSGLSRAFPNNVLYWCISVAHWVFLLLFPSLSSFPALSSLSSLFSPPLFIPISPHFSLCLSHQASELLAKPQLLDFYFPKQISWLVIFIICSPFSFGASPFSDTPHLS